MARYGIRPEKNFGVSLTDIRKIALDIGKDHRLALELWGTGIRDARLLAILISEPDKLTDAESELIVKGLDSWDVCDAFCMWLMRYTPFAYKKAEEWSMREPEFQKRAAFSLIASLAVSDKKAPDGRFESFFPIIVRESLDKRNYVKKAVNWALRGIGKRNSYLNAQAIIIGKQLQTSGMKPAQWIGADAVRELESEAVQKRFLRQNQTVKSTRKNYK